MDSYSVYQVTFLRSLGRTIPLLVMAFLQCGIKNALTTQKPLDHAIRLVVGLLYTFSFMLALKLDTLAVIYSLSYTTPLFMIGLSVLILKEKVGFERFLAALVGMIGVIFIVKENFFSLKITAIIVLFGSFLSALNKILMRRLTHTENNLTIVLYPNIAMLIIMLPCIFIFDSWQSLPWQDLSLFGLIGCITAAAQYLIIQALRYTQASMLAPCDYSTLFWVIALDFIWWDTMIEWSTLIGAALIISSNLFILYLARKMPEIKEPS